MQGLSVGKSGLGKRAGGLRVGADRLIEKLLKMTHERERERREVQRVGE